MSHMYANVCERARATHGPDTPVGQATRIRPGSSRSDRLMIYLRSSVCWVHAGLV